MIILINEEKSFDKIHHPSIIEILRKLGSEGDFLHSIKDIDEKLTANIILN